jgi:tetratricopeptide (TPR) repeat protein
MAKDIFIGRRVAQRNFRDALTALVSETKDAKGFKARKKQRDADAETPQPRLFLLSGESGLGKTSLLSQYVSCVRSVADETKKDITVIRIDFNDFLFVKNVLPFTPRQCVRYLHAVITGKSLGIDAQFSEYDHIERRCEHVREKVASFGNGPLRGMPAAPQGQPDPQTAASQSASAVRGAPPLAPMAGHDAEAALLYSLRAEKKLPDDDLDLYENADYRLAKALVNGLAALSATTPVVLVLDDLERLGTPAAVRWLLTGFLAHLFERKCRVMAICASRTSLKRHFRNLFPEEMISALSCEDETLSISDIDECCQAMRVNLEGQTTERVEAATGGVPIVVRDVLSVAKEGKPIDGILERLEQAPGVRDKVRTMVEHFITTTRDKALITHILHLALLHECDNKVIASLWNCAFADVGTELSELSDHYPFFAGKVMHDAVRQHVREYCMRVPGGDVGDIVTDFAAHTTSLFAEELKRLSTAVPAIDKRYNDERYEHAFLGYVSGLLWQRRDEVRRIMPGCFCECLLYNQVLAGRLLGAIEEFAAVMNAEETAFFSTLKTGLCAVSGSTLWNVQKPPAEKLSLLEMLEASDTLLSAPQQALLHLFRADAVFSLSEYENAYEDLEKCEPFTEESDLFAETLADGFQSTGDAFFGSLRFEAGIKAYGRVAEIRPGRFGAWYGLGRSYAALTRHVEAEDAFVKAAALKSDRWDLYHALADEQFACEKFADAASSYQRAADLFDENKDVWQGLGRSCAALARHGEAVRAFSRAAVLMPDDPVLWYEMGYSQVQLGQASDSIESLEKALELLPDYVDAAALLGHQYAAKGSFPEAMKAFERAVAARPQDAALLNSLGKAAFAAGDDTRAVEAFTRATECGPDFAEAYNNLGRAYAHMDRLDEAAASYEKVIARQPDNADALNNLGMTLSARNRHAEALDAYTKAAQVKPDYADAWYNRGLSLHALGRFEEALQPYAKAATLAPEDPETYFNWAIALYALGKCEEAVARFATTVTLSPGSYDAWYKMGLANADMHRHEDAAKAFARAAELKGDREEAWYNLGCAYALLEKHDEAVAAFEKAVAITPGQYDAWFAMAKSHQECGRFKQALDAYREALKAEGKAEAWNRAGLCSYYLNTYTEAIELLSQADTLAPDSTDTVYTMGLSYHALGNYVEAVKRYRRALELSPGLAHARMNLALSLHAMGKYGSAVEEYRKITESQPENGEAWFNMGRACEAQGNAGDALAAYAKTVEIAPDKTLAWLSMGNIRLSAEQYADAIESFSKGLKNAPDNADAWNNLALASYYTGRFQEAIDAYEKALAIRPDDALAWGSLGLTYYSMGNYAKAVESSEKAVAVKPDELWIQVNLALASVLAKDLTKAATAFDAVISLAAEPADLLHPIANLKKMVARDPELLQARDILTKLENAWRRLKK